MTQPYQKLDHADIVAFLFHPLSTPAPDTDGAFNITIEVDDNITLGCRFHLHDPASPTIVFFHGNGETVNNYESIARYYIQAGINFFVATYRGYGWSTGTPSVANMMHDCHPLYRGVEKLREDHNLQGPLFIMGRSIGSAAAIEFCSEYAEKTDGLIIESGFADTIPLLQKLGVDTGTSGLEEKDGFGNRYKIGDITTPTLILHGAADAMIPIPQAERLQAFSGAKKKKFFVIPGADHNSMIESGGDLYFSTIKDFMDDITGKNTWRERRKLHKSTRQK